MTQPSDVGRRGFLRTMAKDAVQTAGVAFETMTTLNRAASEAAGAMLRPASMEAPAALAEPVADAPEPAADPAPTEGAAPSGFPAPFRADGDVLFVVDEHRLPDEIVEIGCPFPFDVAREIARRSLPGGSVPGAAAAMSLALAASVMRDYLPTVRTATMHIRAAGLVDARPSSRQLRVAVERVMSVYNATSGTGDDGAAIAAAMRREAEVISSEAEAAARQIGELLVEALPEVGTRPVSVLADATGVPFLAAGRHVRTMAVQVVEGGLSRRGARIGIEALRQVGVDHAAIVDAAVGWLLATGRIDAVVVGAEAIVANGDTTNDIGTYPLAVLAARHDVPVYVCAPFTAVDPSARPDARPLGTVPPSAPLDEVTPHDLIAAIVTERGVIRPPFTTALTQPR